MGETAVADRAGSADDAAVLDPAVAADDAAARMEASEDWPRVTYPPSTALRWSWADRPVGFRTLAKVNPARWSSGYGPEQLAALLEAESQRDRPVRFRPASDHASGR